MENPGKSIPDGFKKLRQAQFKVRIPSTTLSNHRLVTGSRDVTQIK